MTAFIKGSPLTVENKNGSIYFTDEREAVINGVRHDLSLCKIENSLEYKLMGGNTERAALLMIENMELSK